MKPHYLILIALLAFFSCKKDTDDKPIAAQSKSTPKKYPIMLIGPRDPIIIDFNNDNIPDFQFFGRESYSGFHGYELKKYIKLLNNDFSFSGQNMLDTLYTDTVQVNYQGYQVNQIKHHNEPNGQHIVSVNPITLITIYDSMALQSATYSGVTSFDGSIVDIYHKNVSAPFEIHTYKRGVDKNGFMLFRHTNSNVIYKMYIDESYIYPPELL